MRDIKFRAKRIDNREWVYGSLLISEINQRFIPAEIHERFADDFSISRHAVDHETIVQFTGLFDKNEKEIYEYDICTFYNKYSHKSYTRVVRYCPMLACFGLYPDMAEVWQYESDWLKIEDIEVIGNIHESPELLK